MVASGLATSHGRGQPKVDLGCHGDPCSEALSGHRPLTAIHSPHQQPGPQLAVRGPAMQVCVWQRAVGILTFSISCSFGITFCHLETCNSLLIVFSLIVQLQGVS